MKNLLFILMLFLCISCTTTKTIYVPVENTKTLYIHNTDSVYLHDSIYLSVLEVNDTIYKTLYKYKILEKYKTDTLVVRDSIPVIQEIEKIVEVNHIHWWQKALMWIGGILILLLGINIVRKL